MRNKNSDDLKLSIWGILEQYGRTDYNAEETYNYLSWYRDKCKNFKYLSITPMWVIRDEEELNILIIKILKGGWEGLVVRNKNSIYRDGQSVNWIKIKKKEREIETKNKNGKVNLKLDKYGIWV